MAKQDMKKMCGLTIGEIDQKAVDYELYKVKDHESFSVLSLAPKTVPRHSRQAHVFVK